MEARELRIGNYILLDTGMTLPMPHKVMPKDIYDISEGRVTLHSIEGLKLTPEILEKAGFKKSHIKDFIWAYEKHNGDLTPDWTFRIAKYGEDIIIEPFGRDKGHIEIKYLHQLQNIHFALTGTELNLEL